MAQLAQPKAFFISRLELPHKKPPLYTQPVFGWKLWSLSATPEDRRGPMEQPSRWFIGSAEGEKRAWMPGEKFRARCHSFRSSCSVPPGYDCTCGVEAFWIQQSVRFSPLPDIAASHYQCVLGRVAGLGRVIEHEPGWRASIAYPVSLAVICHSCLFSWWLFEPAQWVFFHENGERSEGMGLCHTHSLEYEARSREYRVLAKTVQSALCEAYGVRRSLIVHT